MKTLTCDLCGAVDKPDEPFEMTPKTRVHENLVITVSRASLHLTGERRETIKDYPVGDNCSECLKGRLELLDTHLRGE